MKENKFMFAGMIVILALFNAVMAIVNRQVPWWSITAYWFMVSVYWLIGVWDK